MARTATKPKKASTRVDTAIHILLDRSGSMSRARMNTIEGFNKFVREQREEEGVATLSLTQFDNLYEPDYVNIPLAEAPYLDVETYVPRGGTALNDAIAKSIGDFGAAIKASKPKQVLFVIFTDGYENASKEYPGKDNPDLLRLVKETHDTLKWQFVYLGADQDAQAAAQHVGGAVMASAAVAYASNDTSSAWNTVSKSTRSYRGAGAQQVNAFVSDEDKNTLESQVKEGGSGDVS